jgi:hypothetical protein
MLSLVKNDETLTDEPRYLITGRDSYGSHIIEGPVTRERLHQAVIEFCDNENVHYADVTISEIVKAKIELTVALETD